MGRKRKVRRQACSVEITSTGLFRFRFRWKMPDGVVRKFTEATALRDTPENRERVMRQAEMIGAEIRGRRVRLPEMVPERQSRGGIPGCEWCAAAAGEGRAVRPVDRAPVLRRMDRAENCAIRARVRRTRLP